MPRSNRMVMVYMSSIVAALAVTLALILVIMRPPIGDMLYLVVLLAITALASGALGFVSERLGWWRRLGSLRIALTLSYVLAAVLILLNVWVTARLMFINEHDLALATLLLLFASGISIAYGFFISNSVTHRLKGLVDVAEQLSEGDFSARVPVDGKDEVAQLAEAFNEMARQLEQSKAAERALDAARRDLVAWASHDLRTPLASLRAMVDALADGVVDDVETIERYLNQSQGEIERMSALIDDLFELAQLDAGFLDLHGEQSSLADLISDTLGVFMARAKEKRVNLQGRVFPDVDMVWMATDKISRVLYNLLDNALRYTPEGGQVCVDVRPQEDAVLVSVEDSGAGIPPEDIPHVFDRFYRVEKSRSRAGYQRGGTGLGLAIAKGIVRAHGGEMWVESEVGQGTKVCFTLPDH